ncbi:MAG: hypothetical protein QGD90_00230 [Candidatus Hydrogenedentes bacterium]|nr:hypothetical protein [Candidatus Hydrogenedentota bacterium]
MRPILIAVVVAILSLSQTASAEEVFGPNDIAEAVAADVSEAAPVVTNLSEGIIVVDIPFYWDKLTDAGVSLLGIAWKALFTFGGIWLLGKLVGKERAALVKAAIGVSVDYTWDDMGRALKHAAKDRKLDADERQKLRHKAGTHTLTILKGAAKALFESYSISTVNAMISAAVEKRKAISGIAKKSA